MDRKLLHRFVKLMADRVRGQWVIIGGAVLPLLDASSRYTEDIDIVGPSSSTQKDTLALMNIAQELKLPIEAINQAASFFLHKISRWQDELVLIHKGKGIRIFRPTPTLFLLLKISRLSEYDLEDCLNMMKYANLKKEVIDVKRVSKAIQEEIKKSSNQTKTKRLKQLLSILTMQ